MRRVARSVGLLLAGFAIGCITVLGALFAGWPGPKPSLPPILRNVTAGGGWWGACPPETPNAETARKGRPLAISPELDERLSQAFPPGSSEKRLVDTLQAQGFELLSPCNGDTSIHLAAFNQHGGGVVAYPITANVYWKVDGQGHIMWTRGFVRYLAL